MELRWIVFGILCAVMALFVSGVFRRTKLTSKALKSSELERAPESNYNDANSSTSSHH